MQADDQPELSRLAQLFVWRDDTVFGRVIVRAAKTELLLEQLLQARMVNGNREFIGKMFSGYGPLATFGAKIDMCYGLGIIDEVTWKNLRYMKDVRNEFAHSKELIDFEDPAFRSVKKIRNNPLALNEKEFALGVAQIIDHLIPKLEDVALIKAIRSTRSKSHAEAHPASLSE